MQTPCFAKILHDIDAQAVTSREALARLPVTRKSDLKALQAAMKRVEVATIDLMYTD